MKEEKDSCSLKEFIIFRGRKKWNNRKNGAIGILGSIKMVEEEGARETVEPFERARSQVVFHNLQKP